MTELWLIRHGETPWSVSRRHTGRTDLALTERGEQEALRLQPRLQTIDRSLVMTSPLRRAHDTCRIAGFEAGAIVDDNLMEWDYGAYEGRTTAEIREEIPGWDIWKDGVPGGETVEQVGERTDHAIARAVEATGDVFIFAHAHLLRVLAARWLGLEAAAGRSFLLDTASVSLLGHERERRVIHRWNDVSHLKDALPKE